jgi:hypothetical protein
MKSFAMWKMPMLVAGLGAVLMFSTAAKAQSEIAPDHFDGTDSWETSYRANAVKTSKTNHKAATMQAQTSKAVTVTTVRSPKARSAVTTPIQDSVAVAENRKPGILKEKE